MHDFLWGLGVTKFGIWLKYRHYRTDGINADRFVNTVNITSILRAITRGWDVIVELEVTSVGSAGYRGVGWTKSGDGLVCSSQAARNCVKKKKSFAIH